VTAIVTCNKTELESASLQSVFMYHKCLISWQIRLLTEIYIFKRSSLVVCNLQRCIPVEYMPVEYMPGVHVS